jgi:hypothetical protein
LKKAMQTYARQGGTSNIFINDDGLRVRPFLLLLLLLSLSVPKAN